MPPKQAVFAPAPRFIGSEIYRQSSYGKAHPLRIPRVSTVIDLCRALDWLPRDRYLTAPCAKPKALEIWHDRDYLAALQQAEQDGEVTPEVARRFSLGTTSNPIFPEVYRRPATTAGGAMLGAELLSNPGTIFCPGGGTHHGMPDRANGFCYLNDPVLAILTLKRLGLQRVAYIDIDAHHSDGVEHGFREDGDVLMISVHEEKRWPFTGALEDAGVGQIFNLPVPRGFNDTEMRAVLEEVIAPKIAAFRPQAVVLQCGADAVLEDPLSRLALSNNAHWSVVRALMGLTDRLLVLGGGGYNPYTVGRLWTGVWGVLNGYDIPTHLPDDAAKILQGIDWSGWRARDQPEARLWTTLQDPPREGDVSPDLRDRIAVLKGRSV